jgi:hypothetical protein
MLRYAVIGSGYYMASASLRRKRMTGELEATIYRLLEAKFSAETATGVGRGTTLVTFNADGKFGMLNRDQVKAIRDIWENTLKEPTPEAAYEIISKSLAVSTVSDGAR